MKTLRVFGVALFAVLMCVNFGSCSSDDVDPNNPQKPKEYTVSLGFTGEISVSESPLSRTSGDDLYGFVVYSCPNVEGQTKYEQYAYGLFDDISSVTIKLLEGYKYRFATTMIINGKNVITNVGSQYKWPFLMTITNAFTYDKTNKKYCIESSEVGSAGFTRWVADRYYGELVDYIPSDDNNSAKIYMKRIVFGAKYIAENLSEGKLTIAMDDAVAFSLTPESTIKENVYTLAGVKAAYVTDDYAEEVSTVINWEKADGVVVPLGEHKIKFKRNKLTTVTIKVSDLTLEGNVFVELEDEEMGEGDNITIEDGEIIDTTIGTETEG